MPVFKTKVISIGELALGGANPIRIQSMTNTDTMDTYSTVKQSIKMIEAGCEMVRITTQNLKEAENLRLIKKELQAQGFNIPLIADVHFRPDVAEYVARIVEKVRINPGNYVDKKTNSKIEFTEQEYNNELEKIRTRLSPLLKICKEYGTAIRIGINHGSLSDRILSRYGDTPIGMVESAMEFVRICEDLDFHNLVISLKASSPNIMIYSNRLLVKKMIENNMYYPLHLGVTEAGEGEDGRIKSSLGIGTLLASGIGNTIRVSLTEPPECEIPVAKAIVNRFGIKPECNSIDEGFCGTEYRKRETIKVNSIGKDNVPVVITEIDSLNTGKPFLFDKDLAPDYIYHSGVNTAIIRYSEFQNNSSDTETKSYPIFKTNEFANISSNNSEINFIYGKIKEFDKSIIEKINTISNSVIILDIENENYNNKIAFFNFLRKENCNAPVIIHQKYSEISKDELKIYAASDAGSLFIDGYGDGLMISLLNCKDNKLLSDTAFSVLQACKARITKTEYISCPSCGRTLFDLQSVVKEVREKTNHLKGLKIAVMGCIVNGPGEMADADYGYVGAGNDQVNLYYKKQLVKKGIKSSEAVDELIMLIKNNGDWINR
ncbi:MAG: (E)-4-hydroxy-3-methylbut-2-enyl-diphosphate synthase [Bacteroidota bacterium]|nr:(E)-4-hydroxy-3-methylbut-2-enyl-diphosphate synthase [Bacteroidota bacterium]